MIEIKVPALGESISSARIAKLLVGAGDVVRKDENLCLLDTEKISLEVISPADGQLVNWVVKEGDEIMVGAVIGTLDDTAIGTTGAASTNKKSAVKKSGAPALSSESLGETASTDKTTNKATPTTASAGQATSRADVPPAMPRAALAEPTTAQPAYQLPPRQTDIRGEERVKISKIRQVIARRLKWAQNTAATLTTFNEVDMSLLLEIRGLQRDNFEKTHGTKLGLMSFFVKAVCAALDEFPIINAQIEGDDIVYQHYYDIGVAVGSPQGLVVPVLRDADKKSFADIERSIADFGKRAREGALRLDDLSGGTFTITNGGIFGSMLSTPILNPPQSAILGMHKVQERAVVKNGVVVVAPVMYLALSYDHRIIDGREAVSFLTLIKNLLERPERLMLNV